MKEVSKTTFFSFFFGCHEAYGLDGRSSPQLVATSAMGQRQILDPVSGWGLNLCHSAPEMPQSPLSHRGNSEHTFFFFFKVCILFLLSGYRLIIPCLDMSLHRLIHPGGLSLSVFPKMFRREDLLRGLFRGEGNI